MSDSLSSRNAQGPVRHALRRAAAFTLVELLVVIGIIALLISILLPSLNRARQQANLVMCLSNLRSIGTAMRLYANNNKDSLPSGQIYYNGGTGIDTDWTRLIMPYLKNNQNTDYATGASALSPIYHDKDMFESSNTPVWLDQKTSNGYMCHRGLMPDINSAAEAANKYKKPFKLSKIPRQTDMIVLFDGIQEGFDGGGNYWRTRPVCLNLGFNAWGSTTLAFQENPATRWGEKPPAGPNKDAPDYASATVAPYSNGWIRWRHVNNKVANFLFGDGHAGAMNYRSNGENGTAFGGSDLTWRNIMPERGFDSFGNIVR